MFLKNPYVVTLDQVRIKKDKDTAHIDYFRDPKCGGVSLKIGEEISQMTDDEILVMHNDCIRRQEKMRQEYEHVAREVPPWKPQIEFSKQCNQWTPKGNVIRCLVHDGGGRGENDMRLPEIEIDGRILSWEEFGSLLSTYAGWGMRLVFVPSDNIYVPAKIVVKDAEESS